MNEQESKLVGECIDVVGGMAMSKIKELKVKIEQLKAEISDLKNGHRWIRIEIKRGTKKDSVIDVNRIDQLAQKSLEER